MLPFLYSSFLLAINVIIQHKGLNGLSKPSPHRRIKLINICVLKELQFKHMESKNTEINKQNKHHLYTFNSRL